VARLGLPRQKKCVYLSELMEISYTKRDAAKKLSDIRAEGGMPAVFYGRKEESTPITLDQVEFMKLYSEAGESTVITLKTEGEDHEALIQEVAVDPVKGTMLHADFYVVEKGKKVNVNVPIEFEGEAPAEKDLGGVLVKVLHEIEIEATPSNIPHEVHLDISSIVDFDTVLHAKDIKLPEGVDLLTDPEETIVLAQEPKEEVEEEPAEAPDFENIEVEQKGKKEDEEAPEE
jgi:large subunit ribosomal protein L25